MMRKTLFLTVAALAGGLLISSEVQAWGGKNTGYTSVGPGGVQHVATNGGATGAQGGTTAAANRPYGYTYTQPSRMAAPNYPAPPVRYYGYYPYIASPYSGYYYSGFGMTGPSGGFAAGYNSK